MDEEYKNVYRKWEGKIYSGRHPTHIPVGSSKVIPKQQKVPGYCILCPMKGVIANKYLLRRHYQHVHVKYGITVEDMNILACKCSQMKSHGSDGFCRNLHFHCHICHWPRTQWEQMFIHYTTQHDFEPDRVAHLQKGPRATRAKKKTPQPTPQGRSGSKGGKGGKGGSAIDAGSASPKKPKGVKGSRKK